MSNTTNRPTDYTKNGRLLVLVGVLLLLAWVVYFIMAQTGQVEIRTEGDMDPKTASLILLVVFGGGGLFAIGYGAYSIKRGNRFARLVAVIQAESDRSFANLAAAFPTTQKQVVADLAALLRRGYFPGAYMDHKAGVLVLPEVPRKTVDTHCSHCGAALTLVEGEPAVCDYCGSTL